jgi:hypothetical protein
MYAITGIVGKVGGALARVLLVFGLASAGAQTSRAVDHSLEYKAMSMLSTILSEEQSPRGYGRKMLLKSMVWVTRYTLFLHSQSGCG